MSFSPIYPAKECNCENSQTLIALTFDDGFSSWVSVVMPILICCNLTATAFICSPSYLMGDRNFTWADVEELYSAGWEIGWHTAEHTEFTVASKSEIVKDITNSQSLFQSHGLPAPVTFAYPGGMHDFTSMEIVDEYFLAARTCHIGVNSPCDVYEHPARLKTFFLGEDAFAVKRTVNKHIGEGVFIVFLAHEIGQTAGEMSIKDFENVAEFLYDEEQKGNIDVVTFKEGVERMQELGKGGNRSWGIKLDSPFSSYSSVYGFPVPHRFITLKQNIAWDFIGHRYPQIALWLHKTLLRPAVVSLLFLATILFVIASAVVTIVNVKRR